MSIPFVRGPPYDLRSCRPWRTALEGPPSLSAEGESVEELLADSRAHLLGDKKFLPPSNLQAHFRVVVVGEFLARWKRKYARTPWAELEASLSPALSVLERVIIEAADGRAFEKSVRKLARKRMAGKFGTG